MLKAATSGPVFKIQCVFAGGMESGGWHCLENWFPMLISMISMLPLEKLFKTEKKIYIRPMFHTY